MLMPSWLPRSMILLVASMLKRSTDREADRRRDQGFPGSDAHPSYTLAAGQPHCDAEPATAVRVQLAGSSVNRCLPWRSGEEAAWRHWLTRPSPWPSRLQARQLRRRTSWPLSLGLQTGVAMVQSAIATAVPGASHDLSPAWNNQPLMCIPMVTGHNCFGAVACRSLRLFHDRRCDRLDAEQLRGGLPQHVREQSWQDVRQKCTCVLRVVHEHDVLSLFPRCTSAQSREETLPAGGRVPMCFRMCVSTLVLCPGFWLNDIYGACSMVSVPPLCTQAVFWNTGLAPAQYVDFDSSHLPG